MAVRIDGVAHSTPVQTPGVTKCGLVFDQAEQYRSGTIDCPECKRISHQQFVRGFDEYWSNPENIARARQDEARERRDEELDRSG